MTVTDNTLYRSWLTQRIANNLPPTTKFRKDRNSVGQQLVNVTAQSIDALYKDINDIARNNYVETANLDELDVLYETKLPAGTNLEIDYAANLDGIPIFPKVTGVLNSVDIPVETFPEENTIETIWYKSFPTRIDSSVEYDLEEIVPEIHLDKVNSMDFNRPSIPRKLFVTLSDVGSFGTISQADFFAGFIKIEGVTRKNLEEQEVMLFHQNESRKTKKEWKEITRITYGNLSPDLSDLMNPLIPTIKVENLGFNQEYHKDNYSIYVDSLENEKLIHYSLSSKILNSTEEINILNVEVPVATTLGDIINQITYRETVDCFELRDVNDTASPQIIDMAIQPFSRRLYAVSSDKLYVYDLNLPVPELGLLEQISDTPIVVIEPEKDFASRGELVPLKIRRQRSGDRITRFRVKIKKPDNTSAYISPDGTELGDEGWFNNPFELTSRFDDAIFNYTFEQLGTYVVEVEVQNRNSETQVDRKVVYVPGLKASVEFDLPLSVIDPIGIDFDSEQDLYLLDAVPGSTEVTEIAKKIDLFYDYVLIDFAKQTLLFREQYDSVKIVI